MAWLSERGQTMAWLSERGQTMAWLIPGCVQREGTRCRFRRAVRRANGGGRRHAGQGRVAAAGAPARHQASAPPPADADYLPC